MVVKKQDLAESFSKRLKETRESSGLRQADVAKLVGLSEEPYARLERGAALPRIETLVSLVIAFNVTSDSLLGLDLLAEKTASEKEKPESEVNPVEVPEEPALDSADFRRLLRSARKLDARSLNLVAQLSESLMRVGQT